MTYPTQPPEPGQPHQPYQPSPAQPGQPYPAPQPFGQPAPQPKKKPGLPVWAIVLIAVGALCGVGVIAVALGGNPAENNPAETDTAEQPAPAATEYGDVQELRDAVEAAGHECTDFEVIADPTGALERASCTSATTLGIYTDEDQARTSIEAMHVLLGGVDSLSVHLVGPNWTVNCGDDEALCTDLQAELGGELDVYEPAEAQDEQPAEPEPEPDITDGIWTVGVDVDPGTYRTVDVAGEYCYWAILTSGTNGEDIQANYIGGGRPVVVIEDGQDFESSECGGWERVNLRRLMDNADPASTVDDGIWTVGLDIRAGTYRPTEPAGEDCYWAVLAGRTNGNDIINNGIGGGRPTVTVERGQQFEVARCGTWERQ